MSVTSASAVVSPVDSTRVVRTRLRITRRGRAVVAARIRIISNSGRVWTTTSSAVGGEEGGVVVMGSVSVVVIALGHRAGAANIEPLLGWCEETGIEVVTLWLLSTDNLNRPPGELEALLGIIEEAVDSLADQRRWRLHPVGALDLLPAKTARRLKEAEEATRDVDGMLVNIAVGYGGRREIAMLLPVAFGILPTTVVFALYPGLVAIATLTALGR